MRKDDISFFMSGCPPTCKTSQLPHDGFLCNMIFENFQKSFKKFRISLKSDKANV